MTTSPKLFISYSWSTSEHEQWVIDLASELVDSGVDVILDKWELREGHDSIAFMEKMVTDSSITKVILVCDQIYASKADGRSAGVGTETQIISAEVYAKQAQNKFVAVIAEKDDSGKPYLPTYYKSRIYVDLSESDRYAENFEKLLRWIFDKPLFVKPEIGKPPSFIIDTDAPLLGTSALAKRTIDSIKSDKPYIKGALNDYLSTFSENLERFRILAKDGEADDRIVKSIEEFIPSRNEYIHVLTTLSQYGDPIAHMPKIHKFFESLIPYFTHPSGVTTWNELDFDNFKFIIHELFLYTLALLIRAEQFESATYLLTQIYYAPKNLEYGRDTTLSYTVLRQHTRSFQIRNDRLELRRLSLKADLLEQRSKTSGIQFIDIMQADFICFFRANVNQDQWWPETLLYAHRQHGPFELFARSISKAYLSHAFKLLGVSDMASIKTQLDMYTTDRNSLPSWEFNRFNPSVLIGFDQLGTRP